jgi:aerobic-type carbon monoxide dehydrogenase small subunit (CoxS/CutS family)
MAELATVTLRINGDEHALELDTRTSLLDLLRERLGLTGAKQGCDRGQCGACTVLIDGRRANACLALAVIGIVDTAAAVANAVSNATGVRVRDLPITPAKLVGRL